MKAAGQDAVRTLADFRIFNGSPFVGIPGHLYQVDLGIRLDGLREDAAQLHAGVPTRAEEEEKLGSTGA